MKRYNSVDEYFLDQEEKQEILLVLRDILNQTELTETLKWSMPTYTFKNKNIAGIGSFKKYVGLWFFQGALLSDPKKVLVNAQEGKTKAMRQWHFSDIEEIDEKAIKEYVAEAIINQKEGREIKPSRAKVKTISVPQLLQSALDEDLEAKSLFEAMTLYKQKEYTEYIESAKREATKMSRLAKILPMIKMGKGLNDKYR